jgi:hypothetical protein
MKQRKPIYSMILIAVLLSAMFACTSREEQQTILLRQDYLINPTTLIDSLNNDDMSAFTPSAEELDLLPVEQQVTVNWLQADYFYVANSLHERVFGESFQGWELNSMDFQLGCSQISNGFQNGRFTFFKVAKETNPEVRMSSFIDIDPRGNFVFLKEEQYYPKLVDWEVIDVENLKVSADQALQIAESNGGEERRKSVGNACNISLILNPGRDGEWIVLYTETDELVSFFSVLIEPPTGKIVIPER